MKSLTICLTPQDVEQRLGTLGIACSFSPEEASAFATTPVVARPERTFAFPTPAANGSLNLKYIKSCVGTNAARQPSFFEHPWYAEEAFMDRNCQPGWHVVMMDVLEDSIQHPANYLHSVNSPDLRLPDAVEIVLMLFLHYAGTGEQLLLKKHSWCSDLASLGRQVTVGAFGRNGLFISGHPPQFTSRGLGVCARIEV